MHTIVPTWMWYKAFHEVLLTLVSGYWMLVFHADAIGILLGTMAHNNGIKKGCTVAQIWLLGNEGLAW